MQGSMPFISIEKCHVKFCQFSHGVGKKSPHPGIYAETDHIPQPLDTLIQQQNTWNICKP